METIYLILVIATSLIAFGLWKKDSWLIILSSFIYILVGLYSIVHGSVDIADESYTRAFGLLWIFIGVYFSFRASINNFKGVN